jgi:hypothetical protein
MSLEKILAENMLRFGSKNLTEWDQRRLNQILSEQKIDRDIDPSEWNIPGFTAPPVRLLSGIDGPKGKAFFDAYRAYMDFSTGLVGKTLLVYTPDKVTKINDIVLDPADVIQRIVIQSSYVPGPKAKDVAATGIMGQESYIKIWETKQATRNFELATKTAVLKLEDNPPAGVKQSSISLILDKGGDISDPAGGFVSCGGEYSIGMDYAVRKGGAIIGYCPINFSGDSVHKTEGWGTVLVSGGYPTANSW